MRFPIFLMNFKPFRASLGALLLAAALTGCSPSSSGGGGTASAGSPSDALAKVGSSTVTRGEMTQFLEGVYGEQALPQLIETHLLSEALTEKKGSVSDAEVDAELARIEEQDPKVKTTIEAGGARVEVIKNQIRRNITVQKLLTDGIAADPAKVKAFYTQFASYYGTPVQNRLGLLAASTKTRADQLSRALKDKTSTFEALVAEQKTKAATDPVAGQSTPDVGRFETPEEFISTRFPPQIAPQLQPLLAPLVKGLTTAKKGQILPVQALSPQGPFLIVKVVDRKDANKPDFAKVQSQVETDYKMAQVALTEIKKSPTNPQKLEDNVKAVAQSLAGQAPPGTRLSMRDILTTILRPASSTLIEKLSTAGTVQISDPAYKEIAKTFAPVPTPGAAGNSAAGNSAAASAPVTSKTPGHEGHDHP